MLHHDHTDNLVDVVGFILTASLVGLFVLSSAFLLGINVGWICALLVLDRRHGFLKVVLSEVTLLVND